MFLPKETVPEFQESLKATYKDDAEFACKFANDDQKAGLTFTYRLQFYNLVVKYGLRSLY